MQNPNVERNQLILVSNPDLMVKKGIILGKVIYSDENDTELL